MGITFFRLKVFEENTLGGRLGSSSGVLKKIESDSDIERKAKSIRRIEQLHPLLVSAADRCRSEVVGIEH